MSGTSKRMSIQRGKLVGENGAGSLYISPQGDSYLISAVDEWYSHDNIKELKEYKIEDSQMEKFLNVNHFKAVPSFNKTNKFSQIAQKNNYVTIPIQRFPLVHYCSDCKYIQAFDYGDYINQRKCNHCDKQRKFNQFPIVIVCEKGHLSDFPYYDFTHNGKSINNEKEHSIKVVNYKRGSSILDWQLECDCGAKNSLSGITGQALDGNLTPFQKEMGGYNCQGEMPWTGKNAKEECGHNPTAILKNSLNVYRSETISALSIPRENRIFANSWEEIQKAEFDILINKITIEDKDKINVVKSFKSQNSIIKSVNYVYRLQELVVQTGFHRLASSDQEQVIKRVTKNDKNIMFSESGKPTWYPAKMQYGEGIFIEFNSDILDKWRSSKPVKSKLNKLNNRKSPEFSPDLFNNPSNILIHTLSHGLLHELSKYSGYPVIALSEKIYSFEGNYGLLLYVTDTDIDGTFGGLSRLATENKFKEIFKNSLQEMQWCSSDPICFELGQDRGQGIFNTNGSACHNCLYVPDTTCSHRNGFLDRDFVGRSASDSCISNNNVWFS